VRITGEDGDDVKGDNIEDDGDNGDDGEDDRRGR
jgi:hypothetical protein